MAVPPPRLLVVDPSIRYAEHEGVREVIGDWPGETRVLRPALEAGAAPTAEDARWADGVVVLGSAASVHDDLPWLWDLAAWLRPFLDGSAPTPLLGICFAHQLIAHLAGGQVEFARDDRTHVRGVVETTFEGSRLVPGRRTLYVAASHQELVRSPPPGFVVAARRADSPVDALERPEAPVFSVQFHPEAREEFLRRRNVEPAAAPPQFLDDGRRLLAAFRALVLERRATIPR